MEIISAPGIASRRAYFLLMLIFHLLMVSLESSLRTYWTDLYQTFPRSVEGFHLVTLENLLCRFVENTP